METHVIKKCKLESKPFFYLRSGINLIDKIMNDGIPNGSIVDIAGASSTGKSLLAFHFAIMSLLPIINGGLNSKSCFYITSGNAFSSERLFQILPSILKLHKSTLSPTSIAQRILVKHFNETEVLSNFIERQLSHAIKASKAKLIVFDSIAALYRFSESDFQKNSSSSFSSHSSLILKISDTLKKIASENNCIILCINQVSSVMKEAGILSQMLPFYNEFGNDSSLLNYSPALGNVWSNAVNIRLFLTRESVQSPQLKRRMYILFGPNIPNSFVEFSITNDGIGEAAE